MLNDPRMRVATVDGDSEWRANMREILAYGAVIILIAFAIAVAFAMAIAITSRGVRQERYDVTAALFLLFGIPLLSGGILFLVFSLPWICFDYCPPDDIASTIPRYLLIALTLGVNCAGAGWILALISLVRRRLQLWSTLALLSLPVVVLISVLALSQSIGGQLLPHTGDELYHWLTTLNYTVLPVTLCWPLATIITIGMARQPAARALAP
jgi:drug/metabolite transporter (DMT)-like permease